MELDANTQLMFHWIPIVFGLFLMSPLGEGLGKQLSSRWESLDTVRGRTLVVGNINCKGTIGNLGQFKP